jgi:hypothetical protein
MAVAARAQGSRDGKMLHIAEETEMPVCDNGNTFAIVTHQHIMEMVFAVCVVTPLSDITSFLSWERASQQLLGKGVVGASDVGDALQGDSHEANTNKKLFIR